MSKTALFIIGILGCLGYAACGGAPEGVCLGTNDHHDCCIGESDCDEYGPSPDETWSALEKNCKGTLLLCPTHNDTPNVENCVFMKITKACLGKIDVVEGKQPYFYDVLCCDNKG